MNLSIVLSSENIVFHFNCEHQGSKGEYQNVDYVIVLNSRNASQEVCAHQH